MIHVQVMSSRVEWMMNLSEGKECHLLLLLLTTKHTNLFPLTYLVILCQDTSQMDMVQNSLKTLNDSFKESFYYEEDYEEVSKEKEVNGKRKSSDQVSNLDFSAKRIRCDDHKVSDVESMCVEDLCENAECAGAKAGGSEAHVNKSFDEMSNVNNVSGAQCFDASKLLEEKILEFNTEEKSGPNLNENFAKFINSLLANQMGPTK